MPSIPLAERYRWLPTAGKTGRYYDNVARRFVGERTVRLDLDRYIQDCNRGIDDLAWKLRRGEVSLAEWQLAMREQIKAMHLTSAMVAKGGREQMTQADWGRAGREIRRQYEYLDRFAGQVAKGEWPLDGRLNTRAKLYGDAARKTYEQQRRAMGIEKSLTEERRILHAQESCPDCIEYAGRGWQPIGSLPVLGDSICRTNCKCTFEFR